VGTRCAREDFTHVREESGTLPHLLEPFRLGSRGSPIRIARGYTVANSE
jgi:hypothetical protein